MSDIRTYDSIRNEGHIKHAFIFVIYFLHHIDEHSYDSAIRIVLQCGGDTDTNAKIVGNMFGAYYENCIPPIILETVLQFDCSNRDSLYKRPLQYGIQHGLCLIDKFVDELVAK
jgi:ADP-ribosylglycohydrolase